MKSALDMLDLKSEDRYERLEGYSILALSAGALMLSLGIGLSIFATKGIPVILAMLGSLISFLSTISLIAIWLIKDFAGE